MKNAFSAITVLLAFSLPLVVNAQLDLSSLVETNRLPEGMPKIVKWLDIGMSKVNISGLQKSDSQRGDQKFLSFQKTGALPLTTNFPLTGITLSQSGTPSLNFPRIGKSKTISLTYSYEMQAYFAYSPDRFVYNDRQYAFILACNVMRLDDTQILAQTFNFLLEGNSNQKAYEFIKRINSVNKTTLTVPPGELDINKLTILLYNQFTRGKLMEVMFRTFILGKDNKATDRQLNLFFRSMGNFRNDEVNRKLEDMNDPKININMGEISRLLLPSKWASPLATKPVDSLVAFEFQYATANFTLAQKKLTLAFNGKSNQPGKFTDGREFRFDQKKGMGTWQSIYKPSEGITLSELSIELSETGIQILGRSANDRQFLLQSITWPKDFEKANLYLWKENP
ncbi:MAG: hypothetical protein P0Y49_10710 [Candidatus Pedobacter colombiensis]|uniref:Uncharacterized protein n=1 Tax=Candidatus Pedobacter colombiensis TaxID=3121371 RepID=A0AAJ5WA29_9SPHI|nr:hypothetical protein [Pedobacter sp.]WEK21608.1 MAG: hypothetical protein P0Y49_10710 [Pedobacter sp.]